MRAATIAILAALFSVAAGAVPVGFTANNGAHEFEIGYDTAKYAGAIVNLKEWKTTTTYDRRTRKYVTTRSSVQWMNTYDAGRNMQTALHTNERGECYNPTQGGNWVEVGSTRTSKLVESWGTAASFHSKTQMAFWLRPGDTRTPQPGYCPTGRAENTTTLSDYFVSHDVTWFSAGNAVVFDFLITVDTPEFNQSVVLETLTGYQTGDFNVFQQIDPVTKAISTLNGGAPGERPAPVLISNAAGSKAIGVYCAGANFSGYDFVKLASIYTMKWNAVHRGSSVYPGRYQFRCYVPAGTRAEVQGALTGIMP